MEEDLNCIICLHAHEKHEMVMITDCRHNVFGYDCLKEWLMSTSSENSSTCPLCSANVSSLTISDGTLEEIVKPCPQSPKTQAEIADITSEDLRCLDHSYFVPEVERLLLNAEIIERELAKRSRNQSATLLFKRIILKKIAKMNKCLDALYKIYDNAVDISIPIDPLTTLRNLYSLEEQLRNIGGNDPFFKALWDDEVSIFDSINLNENEQQQHINSDNNEAESESESDEDSFFASKQQSKRNKKKKSKQKMKLEKAKAQLQTLQ